MTETTEAMLARLRASFDRQATMTAIIGKAGIQG